MNVFLNAVPQLPVPPQMFQYSKILTEPLINDLVDSPKVPLVLLPYAVLIFVTTGACMYEFSFWEVPLEQKLSLSTLYGPYLGICMITTRRFSSICLDTILTHSKLRS
jgi:hypothetical protein